MDKMSVSWTHRWVAGVAFAALSFAGTMASANAPLCHQAFGLEVHPQALLTESWYKEVEQSRVQGATYLGKLEAMHFAADPSFETKKAAYEKLGYKFEGEKLTVPSMETLIANFNSELDKLGVPESQRIQPSVVFTNGNDYVFVTPGKDPWPTDASLWIVDVNIEPFNLPAKATLKALRQHRWPLLDAFHDASHFASFITHPEYMIAISESMRALPKVKAGSSLPSRMFQNMEMLSLADPRKVPQIRSLLATPAAKSAKGYLALSVFSQTIEQLSPEALAAHAAKITASFDKMMIDYGGGIFHPREKYEDFRANAAIHMKPIELLQRMLTDRRDESYTDFVRDSLNVHTPGRIASLLQLLSEPYVENPDSEVAKKFGLVTEAQVHDAARTLLRHEVAKAEFILWNTSQLTVTEWFRETMTTNSISPNSRTALIMRNAFSPMSYTYIRMMQDQGAR